MPESTIRPDTTHTHEMDTPQQLEAAGEHTQEIALAVAEKIVWTPTFLLTFALTLVIGLSAQSLLSQAWINNLATGQWIILPQIILVALGWLGLGIATRSRWMRIGCIFGGIWAVFMVLNIFTNLQGINPGTPIQSSINAAICMALLGAAIGLSVEDAPLTRWDTWLFFLVPLLGALGVALIYFLTPQASIMTVYNALAAAALIASCLFWWLRPSCWKRLPGPTFLFGLVPAILLIMALTNNSMHDFFLVQVTSMHSGPRSEENNFFFAQISLLCLLLGCMRLRQSEKTH
jgi:hypothetical protein